MSTAYYDETEMEILEKAIAIVRALIHQESGSFEQSSYFLFLGMLSFLQNAVRESLETEDPDGPIEGGEHAD